MTPFVRNYIIWLSLCFIIDIIAGLWVSPLAAGTFHAVNVGDTAQHTGADESADERIYEVETMTNDELLRLAKAAAKNSYSKYSGFSVGAALLTEEGRVFTGCNIENGSFSLTNCAERTAIFKAVSEGFTRFRAVAVAGGAEGDMSAPCRPCGACLQVMSEFCGDDLRIILTDGEFRLAELMPMRFSL